MPEIMTHFKSVCIRDVKAICRFTTKQWVALAICCAMVIYQSVVECSMTLELIMASTQCIIAITAFPRTFIAFAKKCNTAIDRWAMDTIDRWAMDTVRNRLGHSLQRRQERRDRLVAARLAFKPTV